MWEQVANLLAQYGVWGLVLLAFAESSFFPLAPDFLLVPLSLAQPQRALWFAVLSVLASVAGAYCGYLLGRTLGQPLLRRMANPLTLRRMEEAMDRYGAWAVLLAAAPAP
ncbi:MAG: VTT domain-containing protein, partial [Syntrophomonadaceae bacterium]|nr:VTT domain-containing protein [Syntrophomonadaceae bacterium]